MPTRPGAPVGGDADQGDRPDDGCGPQYGARLVEVIANLRDRIDEARPMVGPVEGEGLQTSLNAAAAKLASLDRTNIRRQDATNHYPSVTPLR